MSVRCFDEAPSVKFEKGPSPHEGLVVLKPDRYVCYDEFNAKAAKVVCEEFGFPAAEEYSPQTLPTTATRNRTRRLQCPEGPSYTRITECSATKTDCQENMAVKLKCRAPVGFCDHPGHVSNGQWNSNMTGFGSTITLICGEGFVIDGSATLQCSSQSGWSTYYPVWNSSVPSCRALENATTDKQRDAHVHTTVAKNRESTAYVIQTTVELTTSQETGSGSGGLGTQAIAFPVGTILSFIFILVAIGCMVWCKHYRKNSHPGHPEDSNSSNANITPDACIVHHSMAEHPANRAGGDSTCLTHIYQNAAEDDKFEAKIIKDLADTNSRPLHDVLHQDGEYLAKCQSTAVNASIQQYMDMSGIVKNIKGGVTFSPYRDTSAAVEKEIDASGYLVPSASPCRVSANKPRASCDTTRTFVTDDALSVCHSTSGTLPVPSVPVDDSTGARDFQSPVYEDIPSTFDRSAPIRQLQHGPEYRIIGRHDTPVPPPPVGLNDPVYSASIYLNKRRDEQGVDENGYLILETCAGEIVDDQYGGKVEAAPTACLYKNKTSSKVDLHRTQNSHGKIKSAIYESIPGNQ